MASAKNKIVTPATNEQPVQIPPIQIERFEIRVVGDSPLIMHKWSEKAKKQILDKQMKVATTGRDAKDPQRDFEESIYRDQDGDYAFPSIAFKSAIVSACRFSDGLKMTVLRGAVHIENEFVKILGGPVPREDMVRVGMGSADIRYRAEFSPWSAMLRVAVNTQILSFAQVLNLINLAGFGVGVGEWRPERNGSFGRFHVKLEGE